MTRRRSVLVAVLASLPVLASAQAPAPVAAPPPAPVVDPTVHRHLGFFLRLDGGVGYLSSSASLEGIGASMSGVAIPFGIVIGGAVTENFIIAGDLWGMSAPSPSFTLAGQTTSTSNSGFSLGGLGLNLTWYFMPANVYVSVTPSLVGLTLRGDGATHDSQVGFGTKVGVGKEWWVGDHWGIGLAGQFFLGINNDTGVNPPTWTTLGGGLAFSATYN